MTEIPEIKLAKKTVKIETGEFKNHKFLNPKLDRFTSFVLVFPKQTSILASITYISLIGTLTRLLGSISAETKIPKKIVKISSFGGPKTRERLAIAEASENLNDLQGLTSIMLKNVQF